MTPLPRDEARVELCGSELSRRHVLWLNSTSASWVADCELAMQYSQIEQLFCLKNEGFHLNDCVLRRMQGADVKQQEAFFDRFSLTFHCCLCISFKVSFIFKQKKV